MHFPQISSSLRFVSVLWLVLCVHNIREPSLIVLCSSEGQPASNLCRPVESLARTAFIKIFWSRLIRYANKADSRKLRGDSAGSRFFTFTAGSGLSISRRTRRTITRPFGMAGSLSDHTSLFCSNIISVHFRSRI
jgi:hypothetical protein